jgi:phytoene dehydrogenase-like protein
MMGYMKGGTHSFTHAAQRVFKENGGEYFTSSEVKKIIIENNTAKGIKLTDGTEIRARKLVVSTLSPFQVVYDLIGEEKFNSPLLKKIKALSMNITSGVDWYWFALHELPHYKAQDVMGVPIDAGFWINPGSRDTMRMDREYGRRIYLREAPPYHDIPLNLAVIGGKFTEWDKTQAPEGKHMLLIEQYSVNADAYDEKWWIEHQKVLSRAMIDELHKYAPNITWDTVIGWEAMSPYSMSRLKNMKYGHWFIVDFVASQIGSLRPIPELAGYKVPGIKGSYCTGSGWHGSIGASDWSGYNCYKVIAKDFDVRKPWVEKGRPF